MMDQSNQCPMATWPSDAMGACPFADCPVHGEPKEMEEISDGETN